MLSMQMDLSIKALNRVLDILPPDRDVRDTIYSNFIQTFNDQYGHVDPGNFVSMGMDITISPHEIVEYGGLFRVRNFTLIIRSDTLRYDEIMEVLKGLKAPF